MVNIYLYINGNGNFIMLNILGFGKQDRKSIKVTIEYCPKNITLPYKVKRLINQASLVIPGTTQDSFGFTDKKVRVGEFLNEKQLEQLISSSKNNPDIDEIEIIESSSLSSDLLLD
tara:strand:- start:72 stop:419 length:348 start_codon:yes stop_codon:yes gene_type:complete